MTPQQARDAVLHRHPSAKSEHIQPVSEVGQSGIYQDPYWVIRPFAGLGAGVLGQGATQDAAWLDAARAIEVIERSEMTQRWVTYLLAQGYQWSQDEPRKIVNQEDPELFALIHPHTGALLASDKLLPVLDEVAGDDGGPVI